MSSDEADAVTNAGEQAQGLVPKLRFPEFQGDGDWTRRSLGQYLKEHTGRVSATTEIPVYSSSRSGLTPQGEYFDGSNLQNFGEYSVVPEGYITFRHMSDDGIFKFNQNLTGKPIAVSKEYPVFTTSGVSSPFLLNILNHSYDFKRFGLSQKKGGTRTRLYLSVLRTWEPLLPPSEDEQQKIADCLSSLDAVIAAEEDRLAALKAHKKGLMQVLFPAKDQTTPRLRFPEFEGTGDWEVKNVEELCLLQDGYAFSSNDFIDDAFESTQVIRITDINNKNKNENKVYLPTSLIDELRLTRFMIEKGDLLLSLTGAAGFNFFIWNSDPAIMNQRTMKITLKAQSNEALKILLIPLLDEKINVYGSGQNNNLSKELLRGVSLLVPKPSEQKNVADLISSIDSLINAQDDKVEALKTNKKGLMQQLFPSPVEAKA